MEHPETAHPTPAIAKRPWLFAILLLAATAAAYQPAWNGKPLWDDAFHLTRPELQSFEGLSRIWTVPGATQQYYPLLHSVFWVEHQLWGDHPAGYHWVNLLLHCLNALLLFQILKRLDVRGAWLAAAIFALHPIEVESVAWMTELKNTLSGAFFFGATLVYLRFDADRKTRTYLFALALFLLGLMSKSVIATLPAALLVVFWWKRGRLNWKRDLLPLIPFFTTGLLAGLTTAWIERKFIGAEGASYHLSVIERFLIAGRAVFFYLGKIVWPVDLVFIYPRWEISATSGWQYLFPAGVLLLLLACFKWRKSHRWPLAALLIFILTLFPVLGFLNVYPFRYSFVADHFQYLAGIVPIAIVAATISSACTRTGWMRSLQPLFCGALLVILGTLTWKQCAMYTDVETLWRVTIQKNPGCWMAHDNLGAFSYQNGRFDEAIVEFQKALEINPNYEVACIDLGSAYLQKGEVDKAIRYYQQARKINPDNPNAYFNLGNGFMQKRKPDEAIANYQRALELKPEYTEAHSNLAALYFQQGRMTDSIGHYQQALDANPLSAGLLNNLAWVLLICPENSLRNGAKALDLAQKANRLTGGTNSAVLHTLAAAYAETGQYTKAIETAQTAFQLAESESNPSLMNALQNEIKLYQDQRPLRPRDD